MPECQWPRQETRHSRNRPAQEGQHFPERPNFLREWTCLPPSSRRKTSTSLNPFGASWTKVITAHLQSLVALPVKFLLKPAFPETLPDTNHLARSASKSFLKKPRSAWSNFICRRTSDTDLALIR